NAHFSDYFLQIDALMLCRCAPSKKGLQTVDNVGCAIAVLLNPGGCCPRSFHVGWIMRQPSQKSVGARDRGSDGLLDFVCQRCSQLSHHVDSVDVCEISL